MDTKATQTRSKEEITRILQDWEQSGLSKRAFSEQRQIKYQTFIGWMVRRNSKNQPAKNNFIPVQLRANPSGPFAEIHLSGSRKVVLHQVVNPEVILAILKC